LNEQVERVRAGVESWQVFPGPAGSGKTQGLMFWLSMLPDDGHLGVLVVICETKEADEFVKTLNNTAGRSVAIAFHTNKTNHMKQLADLTDVPILTITHKIYKH